MVLPLIIGALGGVLLVGGIVVTIDGMDRPAVRIDTDPHVFAIGTPVDDTLVTVVVNRDELPRLTLEVATRSRETSGAD